MLGYNCSLSSRALAKIRMAARAGPGPRPKVRVTISVGLPDFDEGESHEDFEEDAGVASDYSESAESEQSNMTMSDSDEDSDEDGDEDSDDHEDDH